MSDSTTTHIKYLGSHWCCPYCTTPLINNNITQCYNCHINLTYKNNHLINIVSLIKHEAPIIQSLHTIPQFNNILYYKFNLWCNTQQQLQQRIINNSNIKYSVDELHKIYSNLATDEIHSLHKLLHSSDILPPITMQHTYNSVSIPLDVMSYNYVPADIDNMLMSKQQLVQSSNTTSTAHSQPPQQSLVDDLLHLKSNAQQSTASIVKTGRHINSQPTALPSHSDQIDNDLLDVHVMCDIVIHELCLSYTALQLQTPVRRTLIWCTKHADNDLYQLSLSTYMLWCIAVFKYVHDATYHKCLSTDELIQSIHVIHNQQSNKNVTNQQTLLVYFDYVATILDNADQPMMARSKDTQYNPQSATVTTNALHETMHKYMDDLQLPDRQRKLSMYISDQVLQQNLCYKRTNASVSAGCIYLACTLENNRITQHEYCNIVQLTEVTLRKVYRELVANWPKLVWPNYHPKVYVKHRLYEFDRNESIIQCNDDSNEQQQQNNTNNQYINQAVIQHQFVDNFELYNDYVLYRNEYIPKVNYQHNTDLSRWPTPPRVYHVVVTPLP